MKMMQSIGLGLLTVVALWLTGCKEEPAEKGIFTLTVTNGTGTGSYMEGTRVSITAFTPPFGEEFAGWAGDIATIENVNGTATFLVMPNKNIAIEATFRRREFQTVLDIPVNFGTVHQTMEGFGFFGGRDVWWGSPNPSHFYSDAWLEKVIGDLGLSMWRNELYPHDPPTSATTPNQDANWDKQRPMAQALKAKADQYGVDLKIILTAWTPPGSMKWNSWNYTWPGDENAQRGPGPDGDFWPERGQGLPNNNSGSLNPNRYNEFAQWWIEGIDMYKEAGLTVYAISPQNEPAFKQFFNSCFYTTHWYAQMINNVIPLIKAAHPDVLVFGAEHMLLNEGRERDFPFFYHARLKSDPTAMQHIDALAVHGYQDGVNASSGSVLAQYWTNHKREFADPASKKTWMTETSGYLDTWEGSGSKPGAFGLGIDIATAILFGDVSAWVYWQGSNVQGIDEFCLMSDLTVGKKYHASRNFYHFIRPGAVRLGSSSTDAKVTPLVFRHTAHNTQTIVLINTDTMEKGIRLTGNGGTLAERFEIFVTSATQNSQKVGEQPSGEVFVLPPRSIVTLHAGGSVLNR